MNDSNNIFGNDSVTPTPQPTNPNEMQQTNDLPENLTNNTEEVSNNQVEPQDNTNTNIEQPTNNTIPVEEQPNIIPPQQNVTTTSSVDDEELLRAFIGDNYEKITTQKFNVPGFFFNSLYMCYRKMFGYGILTFLAYIVLYIIVNAIYTPLLPLVTIGLCFAIGFLVNKIYLNHAKKKVAIIKAMNNEKSNEELRALCTKKGGTSVGNIFLGLLAQIGIAIVALFIMALIGIGGVIGNLLNPSNWNTVVEDGTNQTNSDSGNTSGALLEDVIVSGYGCFNSKCNVTIETTDGNSEDYALNVSNNDLFTKLGHYKDYIKLDINYNKKGKNKTIVDYKLYLKSNNEDISSVSTESELREKIGLYLIGTHTETMTLKEIGMTGFGSNDDESYTYTDYTFTDSKNIEYEMRYRDDNGALSLTEGKQYSVTFEVTEGTFDYEYEIKSVK